MTPLLAEMWGSSGSLIIASVAYVGEMWGSYAHPLVLEMWGSAATVADAVVDAVSILAKYWG